MRLEKIREYEIKMGMNQPEYQYKKRLEKLFKTRGPVEAPKPAGKGDKSIGYKHYIYRMVGFEWRVGSITKAEKGNGYLYSSYWMQQIKHMVYHESSDFDFDPGYYKFMEITASPNIVVEGIPDLSSHHQGTAKVMLEMISKLEEDFVIDEKLFEDIHLCPRPRMRSTGDFDQPSCEVNYERPVEELLSLYEQPSGSSHEHLAEPVEFQHLSTTLGVSVGVEPTVEKRQMPKFSIKVTPPDANTAG